MINPEPTVESSVISFLALDDHTIAVDFHTEYARTRPSLLVPDRPPAIIAPEHRDDDSQTLRTKVLHVDMYPHARRLHVYRIGSQSPVCELLDLNPAGVTVVIDRGFALYGLGGSNHDHSIDRRGGEYRVHHRMTGQGNNYMPWVLSARGFGLFFDSSFPMTIDLRDNFVVHGQNIRTCYFINGSTPAEALQRFIQLTGLPPMHPAWALGYEQSSRTWMGSGELDFVTSYFRAKRIPCDGLDLLSTYGGEGGVGRHGRGFHEGYPDFYQGWNVRKTYRKYNRKMFPNRGSDVSKLRERGFHPIVHGYWLADYSDPEAAESYWQDHKFLIEDGWNGWWLDGMESVWDAADDRRVQHVPQDYLPSEEKLESPAFRDEYDNVWALLRAKAFYERQRRDFPDKRVYILNRTAFTGMQRYAAGVNQGDYWSSWDLLRVQLNWLLNMSVSGVLFPESDIGGFYPTEELTDELIIRWAFVATFQPLMRSHGCNWRCRLPWGFGPENEARFIRLIRLRYSMFPYNYTLLRQANQTGVSMMRPMVLEFPSDIETRQMSDQYMWGPNVLVAPVTEKGARERTVYLPEGGWVHFWTLRVYEGPGRVNVEAPLGQDPFFVRVSGILPMCEPSDNIRSESGLALTLLVLPGPSAAEFSLYDDDRQTYRYEQGEFSVQTFSLSAINSSEEFTLQVGAVEGHHKGMREERRYRVEVPRSLAKVCRVIVDGREIPCIVEEESSAGDRWFVLLDRYVVQLDRRPGPFKLEFQ